MTECEDEMSEDIRKRALRILNNQENESHTSIHNAIVDLRRNALKGDERYLYTFLNYDDAMVVAATLYTLFEIHNQKVELRDLIEKLAVGDVRDDMEMPIQSMAISLLSRYGIKDTAAIALLLEIAESQHIAEVPRKNAWQKLAEIYNVDWSRQDADNMILYPESDASEQIRKRIKNAMKS
jgi:hypothetical protein